MYVILIINQELDRAKAIATLINQTFNNYYKIKITKDIINGINSIAIDKPKIIITDFNSTSFELKKILIDRSNKFTPRAKIINCYETTSSRQIFCCLGLGIKYFCNISQINEILIAVDSNSSQTSYLNNETIKIISGHFKQYSPQKLTKTEQKILCLAERNFSNEAIAAQMKTSINTVKSHFQNIKNKLQASKRKEMIQIARDYQLIG